MKPRVFVSSTFYDLRYIREDLSNFIRTYGFEPIMFEDGDIGYAPGNPLDSSCYESMKTADMVILIVGGNYGSPASDQNFEFGEYLSITRKEFRTAIENGVPIFVFVDSSVKCEYGIYEENIEQIEENKRNIIFKSTKSINVFRFIHEIMGNKNIAVTEFDSAISIKSFLSKQWADMFKNYLQGIKNDKQIDKLNSTVKDIELFVEKMNIMLTSIGQKVLGEDYHFSCNDIIQQQDESMYGELCELISSSINFHTRQSEVSDRNEFVNRILDVLLISKGCIAPGAYDIPTDGYANQSIKDCAALLGNNLSKKGFNTNSYDCKILYELEKLHDLLQNEKAKEKIVNLLTQDKYYEMFFIENVLRKLGINQ